MKIAVNARSLAAPHRNPIGQFTYEVFSRLVISHPGHDFVFIYDQPGVPDLFPGPNVNTVVAGPRARHPLLWKWWFDVSVPRVLKKYKADVFVSCDGHGSLLTQVPQCLVVHDLAYLHFPQHLSRAERVYRKRYVPRFLEKAGVVAAVSQWTGKEIENAFDIEPGRIAVVPPGARNVFRPLVQEDKAMVKSKYSSGREYFLYTGTADPVKNLINLLKAFSFFKKRLQSGMKLVIAEPQSAKNDVFAAKLKSYRYREDVIITGYLPDEELARLTGAAYALVYPSLYEGFGAAIPEAMCAGVPVITSSGTAMVETGGDAALYADPENPADIAEKMMLLYKDENLRNELIRKGLVRGQQFNWDETASRMWTCIRQAIS